jgi:hypothetical protein
MPTDQHQCLPGSRAPAIKNLHRETLQVDVVEWCATFFGGDDARVHLQDCQGGGLRCGARCPGCSTHSLPQVTSAGRNLITVFSAVNTLSQLFSIASAYVPDVGAHWKRTRTASATSSANSLHDACFIKLLFFSAFIQSCRHCTNQQPRLPAFLHCMRGRLIAPGNDEK